MFRPNRELEPYDFLIIGLVIFFYILIKKLRGVFQDDIQVVDWIFNLDNKTYSDGTKILVKSHSGTQGGANSIPLKHEGIYLILFTKNRYLVKKLKQKFKNLKI